MKQPTSVSLATADIEIGAVEIKNGADDTRAVVGTAGADGVSNTQNELEVSSRISGFNGTTWDRIRTAVSAATGTLTGLLSTLPTVIYNSTPPTQTTGQVVAQQSDARGNTKVAINDGANQVAVTTAGADGVSNTQNELEVQARLAGFNGTTWDRIRTAVSAATGTLTGLLNTLPTVIYNSTPPTQTNGQVVAQQSDARGNTKVAINDGANQVAVTTAGADGVSNTQNDLAVESRSYGFNGTTWDRLRTAIIAATSTVTGILNTIPTAIYNTTRPASTAGQILPLQNDTEGKLITLPYARPGDFVSGAITTAMTGTTSTSLLAAPAAGLRNYVTNITVSNAHATVGTDLIVQDGSGGTTLYTIPAAAAYGGASITFPVPLRQPTTATALYIANVTTGSSTKASASGYQGA